jgi:predicted dehydrogenase
MSVFRQKILSSSTPISFQRLALVAQVFADHGELLDSGVCDVVVIATPDMTHAQILLDVLAHPRAHHVLVEKPLCTTVADCYKVIPLLPFALLGFFSFCTQGERILSWFLTHVQVLEAAKARPDVLVQVGLEYRYIPAVAELLTQVKQNAVTGCVRMVAIREHRFPFLVKVQTLACVN